MKKLFEEFCPGVSPVVETGYGHGFVTSKKVKFRCKVESESPRSSSPLLSRVEGSGTNGDIIICVLGSLEPGLLFTNQGREVGCLMFTVEDFSPCG